MNVTLPHFGQWLGELGAMVAALPADDVMSSGSRGRLLSLTDRIVRGHAEQALARYARRPLATGFEVHADLLAERAGSSLAERLADTGVTVEVLPFRRLFDPAAGWRLLHHVRRLRPELIHT
jgi:hypothetical protein